MAFGRSNSLSINTGATNSLFAAQQNTSNPPSQPAQTGGLFGSTAQKPGGLFGSQSATTQSQGSGLFGANNNATNTTSQTGGGLFGSGAQQSQPQQSGSLFGGALGANNQQQNQAQNTAGGSLFGGLQQNKPEASTQGGTSLFPSLSQQPKPSLFGGLGQSQPAQTQPAQSGGLFGSLNAPKQPNQSLFGTSTAQAQPQQQQPPSLLSNSLFQSSTLPPQPLGGSLQLGQSTSVPSQTQPGVKIDITQLRPTTRFSDLHDDLRRSIEQIDAFIRQQESFASQCEALLPSHDASVSSLGPDVSLIASRAETVELGLENDSKQIAAAKETLAGDVADLARIVRVVENQSLPARFHYGPGLGGGFGRGHGPLEDGTEYDVDLLGYFARMAEGMGRSAELFGRQLGEIEAHLGVVERSAGEAVEGVRRERGGGGGAGGENTVGELAATLRGFEEGILDAAGRVGGVREGVQELVLGRAGY